LAKYYLSEDKKSIENGLEILNLKVFCHYTKDGRENLEKLKQHKEKLATIVIPDYKYVVLEL